MASLYADENFPFQVVHALAAAGHDILTALADGRAHQRIPDPQVLTRATALGRAVVTNDRKHYVRLHASQPGHAGIIASTFDPDHPAHAARILAALAGVTDLAGRLITVDLLSRPRPTVP